MRELTDAVVNAFAKWRNVYAAWLLGRDAKYAARDLYFATAETWGITLLVRTGSAAHNVKLAEHGKRLAPARRLSVARGILDTADNVVASRTEEEIFGALGLRYVDPELREAPEYASWIRDE